MRFPSDINRVCRLAFLLLTYTGTARIAFPLPVMAQDAQATQRPDAMDTRRQLQQVFRQYPSTLADILRLDPSLLSNAEYLAPYPALSQFLTQHPEVAHNPSYFLGEAYRGREMRDGDIAMMFLLSLFLGVFAWLVKISMGYRRWVRILRMQEEMHSKLLGRFSSNEDLLAYMQTPAASQLLESTALLEGGLQSPSAPLARILWSVQAGLVLAFGGIGLYYAFLNLSPDHANEAFFVVSVLSIALGIGFIISAVFAYAFSKKLGLLEQRAVSSRPASATH